MRIRPPKPVRTRFSSAEEHGTKAISVKSPTTLLVFSPVFRVVATVAEFDYALVATP